MTTRSKNWLFVLSAALYAGTFICFFVVGLIGGFKARSAKALEIFHEGVNFVPEPSSSALLIYTCNGETAYSFHPDRNRIRRSIAAGSREYAADSSLSVTSLETYRELVTVVVGGGSGGLSVKALEDIRKLRSVGQSLPTKIRRLVQAFLSSVSGYAAGYWLGSSAGLDCRSAEVNEIASQPQSWVEYERMAAIGLLERILTLHETLFVERLAASCPSELDLAIAEAFDEEVQDLEPHCAGDAPRCDLSPAVLELKNSLEQIDFSVGTKELLVAHHQLAAYQEAARVRVPCPAPQRGPKRLSRSSGCRPDIESVCHRVGVWRENPE